MPIKVGVLRGGPSMEHEVSLKTGKNVLSFLPSNYFGHDIFLTKNGEWYLDGKYSYPEKIFRSIDVVFNALHGYYGEDGKVQHLMEIFGVPYTGSGVFPSALGMNKAMARESFSSVGLTVPAGVVVEVNESPLASARKAFSVTGGGWIIKPNCGGSSVGISVAKDYNELVKILSDFSDSEANLALDKILIEEYVKGREFTCGVLEKFRGAEYYSLPVVEIIPSEGSGFFDYNAKYGGQSREICPAQIDMVIKKEIERMAIEAHKALGCRHYSRSDFILKDGVKRGDYKIYILEINTLPGLTNESLLPKSIEAVGSSYPELLDHLIKLALEK